MSGIRYTKGEYMLLPNADVRTIRTILADLLPPPERREFVRIAHDVTRDSFWNFIAGYFSDQEIKAAISYYCATQLEELEHSTGTKIDALITVAGTRYVHGNFYEEVS
jgi:hypothetical protein